MNRRTFFSLTAGALLGGGLPANVAAKQQRAGKLEFIQEQTGNGPVRATANGKRPHILLISADMVGLDLYHPSRSLSRHVHLPAIRSLMPEGTFFSNAFCTVPLCSPSRASYLTGRYSYVQGNGERAPIDGMSLLPAPEGRNDNTRERPLLFFGGWHVRVNFDCGIQHRAADGHRYLDAYNCNSPVEQVFDLDSEDATNLIDKPELASVRKELILKLGGALQFDP